MQVGDCTRACTRTKQRLVNDKDSLSSEQERIDLPTIETKMEREASVGLQETSGRQAEVGTQTAFLKYLLSAKVDSMLLKNEVALMKTDSCQK